MMLGFVTNGHNMQCRSRIAWVWLPALLPALACSVSSNDQGRNDESGGATSLETGDLTLESVWSVTLDTGADDEMADLVATASSFYVLGTRSDVASVSGVIATLAFEFPFVSKRDLEGNELWFKEYAAEEQYRAVDMAAGPGGQLAVATTTLDEGTFQRGGQILVLTEDGTDLWAVTFPTSDNTDPMTVGMDGEGSVVVGGDRGGAPWLAKYSPDAEPLWTNTDIAAEGTIPALAVADDGSAIVIVSERTGTTSPARIVAQKYSSSGGLEWSRPLGSGLTGGQVSLGKDNSVYFGVEGDTNPSNANVIVHLSATGEEIARISTVDREFPLALECSPEELFQLAGNHGDRKLSQYDPETMDLLVSQVIPGTPQRFALVDDNGLVLGLWQDEDIGLEYLRRED